MNCPHCGVNLLMAERQGVEIDYCPECRGVWLDRGELDKIIERSHAELVGSPTAPTAPTRPDERERPSDRDRYRDDDRDRYRDDDRDRYRDHGKPKKKRKSFLEDIFEF
jgi:Zn-finger nucleic acid-binding protein